MMAQRSIARKLLLLMLLTFAEGMHGTLSAQPMQPFEGPTTYALGRTADDTPSWQDLGLEDLLVNANESTVVVVPQTLSSHQTNNAWHAASASSPTQRRQPVTIPERSNDYYLYFLYRLRL
mgnify:CR=1 FL=1